MNEQRKKLAEEAKRLIPYYGRALSLHQYNETQMHIQAIHAAIDALASLAEAPAATGEAQGMPLEVFQHDETGRLTCVQPEDAAHFAEHNPRWHRITWHPAARPAADVAAMRDAPTQFVSSVKEDTDLLGLAMCYDCRDLHDHPSFPNRTRFLQFLHRVRALSSPAEVQPVADFQAWAKSVEWWDFDSEGRACSRRSARAMAALAFAAGRLGVIEPGREGKS